MKKFILAILFLPLIFSNISYAQSITPKTSITPDISSPTQKVTEKLNEQINDLKDRIASRVAQLNLVEKRGIVGTINVLKGQRLS